VPLGSIPELPAYSCKEIKASEGGRAVTGNYWLDSMRSGNSLLAHCDMHTNSRWICYFLMRSLCGSLKLVYIRCISQAFFCISFSSKLLFRSPLSQPWNVRKQSNELHVFVQFSLVDWKIL